MPRPNRINQLFLNQHAKFGSAFDAIAQRAIASSAGAGGFTGVSSHKPRGSESVGYVQKQVVDLLRTAGQPLSPGEIEDRLLVAIRGDDALLESLRNNEKLVFTANTIAYKPTYEVNNMNDVLATLASNPEGVLVHDLTEGAYANSTLDIMLMHDRKELFAINKMPSKIMEGGRPAPVKMKNRITQFCEKVTSHSRKSSTPHRTRLEFEDEAYMLFSESDRLLRRPRLVRGDGALAMQTIQNEVNEWRKRTIAFPRGNVAPPVHEVVKEAFFDVQLPSNPDELEITVKREGLRPTTYSRVPPVMPMMETGKKRTMKQRAGKEKQMRSNQHMAFNQK